MEKMPSFEDRPEKKSSAGKWLKRTAALAGAAAVGYFGALKREKTDEEVHPTKPLNTVEAVTQPQTPSSSEQTRTHVEMRHVNIADGIEQEHAIEVDEKGNPIRDLGVYHLWKEAQIRGGGAFQGYGTETRSEGSEVTQTPYGSKSGTKTIFSGYGISTETEKGKVIKTPYGENKDGKKKFRGYGIEQ